MQSKAIKDVVLCSVGVIILSVLCGFVRVVEGSLCMKTKHICIKSISVDRFGAISLMFLPFFYPKKLLWTLFFQVR